ncbi:MAG TPA: exosortase A [Acetobacteraceae bacterium]|nr:exosortase A [Acetobacteraceae bacterium]
MSAATPLARAWPALIGGLMVFGAVFEPEVRAAVGVWMSSTAYNHCFLILPIAAWLAWQRRAMLSDLPLRPTIVPLPVGLLLGAIWFLADRLGVMEGRQLAAVAFVQLLFLSVLGWRIYRVLAAPLLYLFFLVPFGGFLVPLLQSFSTHFVVHGLDLLGIPNFNDGNAIEIPEGTFYIATACAGLRFLIAAIAFSVFYSCVIYRSPSRRLLFIAVSLFVPVLANGIRCLGIVWLGHVLGSASAAATDHVLYGYLFFSLVLFLLILLGLIFREDLSPRLPPSPPVVSAAHQPVGRPRCFVPAIVVVILAALFPLLTVGINRAAAATRLAAPVLLPHCVPLPDEGPPALAGAGGLVRRFACEDSAMTITLAAFPPRSDPRLVFDTERALSGQNIAESETRTLTIPGAIPASWQLVIGGTPPRVTANAVWIDAKPVPGGLRARWHQALNSLFGGRYPPLVVTLRAAGSPPEAEQRLAAFLASGTIGPAVMKYIETGAFSR